MLNREIEIKRSEDWGKKSMKLKGIENGGCEEEKVKMGKEGKRSKDWDKSKDL